MIERMTDRAREVLVNAQTAAQQCGHGNIEAPHLLMGILRRRDTKGCQALNHAGLRYLDVLIAVQDMYQRAPTESGVQPSFTAEAEELLEAWMGEAPGPGQGFVETAHLALACSQPGRWPSLVPFVAGREHAIRDGALSALRRSARLEAELNARRRPVPRDPARQRRDALGRADHIRSQRARLKAGLKSGRVSVHRFLLDPPDYLLTAKVADLLMAMPKFGRVKVNKLLNQCRISPSKTVGGLSPRQRLDLLRLL